MTTGKKSSLALLHYKVIIYCPRCTNSKLINLNDYPGYTLEDIHLRMVCSGCNAVGVDFLMLEDDTYPLTRDYLVDPA